MIAPRLKYPILLSILAALVTLGLKWLAYSLTGSVGLFSEAAESAALMPSLRRNFTIVEEHSYGSILHLALHDIAHNFMADDPATAQVVQQCIAAEDQALARLGPNFVLAVCRPRDKPGT